MRCGGIVLTGGKSSRMGTSKAMLPFGPELMLQRIVRLLGQVVEPIAVVAAADQPLPPLPSGVIVAHDRRPERGPLEGLAAGLAALEGRVEAAYATSCDVPLLAPDFVGRLIELAGDFDVVVPRTGGYHHPLAALYRLSVRPHIEALLAEDRLRPVFLFERVRTREVSADELTDVDPALDTLKNLNYPEDYRAALAQAGFEAKLGDEHT
jgi:molybdopterin-guanine dinucleotide biosynthesis protein A